MPVTHPKSYAEIASGEGQCSECGFLWALPVGDAAVLISDAPERYRSLIEGRDARVKPAPDVWSPSAYVWHMSDSLRTWAERLWGIRNDPGFRIVPWDQDEMAIARSYEAQSMETGLWSLERAVTAWELALEGADPEHSFEHPEMGTGSIGLVVRYMAHEVFHHDLDIRRGLGLI